MNAHPTALIDPSAVVAAGVTIGPYAVIGAEVRIGSGTVIGPHAVIEPFVTIGANCRIHGHAVIGDLPQDLGFKPGTRSFVRIGDGCTIRESVTIHRGTKEDTVTVVDDGCFLMAGAHVAHNCRLGRRVIVANNVLLAGYVEVGDGAFLSGGAVVHQFTKIGRLALLSGNSGIGKDIPPFCIAAGVHLNSIAGLNVVGMRRAGLGPEDRKAVKRAFDLLYRSGLNFRDVPARIRAEFASGPALEIADFIGASKRGICPFRETAGAEEE